MNLLRILVVEDDDEQINTWERQIERFEAITRFDCSVDFAGSKEEAEKLIKTRKYDASIIDIRLKNNDGAKDATCDGNQVRDVILSTEIMLIAHITGEPNQVDELDAPYKDLVRVFVKGGHEGEDIPLHEVILNWIKERTNIIYTMNHVKEKINKEMAGLFYSSIWQRWDSWSVANGDEAYMSTCLSRHMSAHLYSELLEHSNGRVHPEEWYFQPPKTERFNTGDVFHFDDSYYVLVTPRCDLERMCNSDMLILARLDVADSWKQDKADLQAKLEKHTAELQSTDDENRKVKLQKNINRDKSEFRKIYYGHKNNTAKLHFLPEINQSPGNVHGPFYVDFSNITTIQSGSEKGKQIIESKIASISSEFVPSLVQRLGSYVSRIGSPDYSHIY